ncbi:MAG: AAC(3) family N-acetyltransferase [Lachnospiraceae bacterium]|nr:AAC(3) family N-acetyltransferase [Lachnospiraceae bacterium]
MSEYIKIRDLASHLHLHKGQQLFVTSDVKQLLYLMIQNNDETDLNILIDSMIEILGEEGSLVFPTFNWSFCKGETYDHYKTPCKTGSLGKTALKRKDFERTEHPIYSFAVYGRCKEDMLKIHNKSSFGADSPFTYMMENNFDNLFIDKDLQHSFVFVHYVEEQNGPVPYRYLKDFTADYIDREGKLSRRTYSMNVRDLDMDVQNRIYPYEPDFIEKGAMERFYVNDLEFKIINLRASYDIIADDVRNNRSRKLCSYIGQEDD